jgi:hemerythrin-like domain-containing protein
MMEATKLLRKQHEEVKRLFAQYEDAGPRSEKNGLFEKIADALAAHSTVEEKLFYPSVYVGPLKSQLEEAVEEHLAAKRIIADLLKMAPEDKQFDAKMAVLKEAIEHHVEEEEGELFPKVEKNFESGELAVMGEQMETMFEELVREEPRRSVPGETGEAAPLG